MPEICHDVLTSNIANLHYYLIQTPTAPPSILILIASSQPDSQRFIAISPPHHHHHQYVVKLYPSSVDVKTVIGFR